MAGDQRSRPQGHLITDGPFTGLVVPPGGFRKILADPPWGWRTWGAVDKIPHRGAIAPYQPMSKQDLEALPVSSLAATHCLLAMWTISSHLDQAIDLMRAWHFTFRSIGFIWVKTDKAGRPRMSLGRWTRQEAEVCILGARGRPPRRPKPIGTGVRQVIMAQRREHSRKPDQVRAGLDRLVLGPGLELFSRESAPGWAAWGDEAGKFDGRETDLAPEAHRCAAADQGETVPVACRAHVPGAICDCHGCAGVRRAVRLAIAG